MLLSAVLLLVLVGLMVLVDFFADSREPAEAEIEVAGGASHTGRVVRVTRHRFHLKGFILENGSKILVVLVAVFALSPYLTDAQKEKYRELMAKVDSIGKKVEVPEVTDDEINKVTVSADRKSITVPKLQEGEWILVLAPGKAYKIDNGESGTFPEVIQPTAELMKLVGGKYSPPRKIGK